jgi:transposase, IS6 family
MMPGVAGSGSVSIFSGRHYPKDIEAMHALRKGQGRIFAYGHSNPDVVIVEKAFAHA